MEALPIREDLVIPASHLSVSFTRSLDGEDAAVAARSTPSSVELRFDTRGCPGLDPRDLPRIEAYRGLRADRRGTVRVSCSDFRSRARNLDGARQTLRILLLEALDTEPEPAVKPRKKRGRVGLNKTPHSPVPTD